jgi:predicted glycosyltransferase
MKILLEAHHPAHIHFWKFPVRTLIERGHEVRLIGRDRDVMKRLLEVYDWIPSLIPRRQSRGNRFPIFELIRRQLTVARQVISFQPHVVASLMGSYCQLAGLLGCRNVIFTDSEFQHFNHRIAHPFADEIYTPYCFYKDLGKKQHRYKGIHELIFLGSEVFQPDSSVLEKYNNLEPGRYILIRISAWNTLHDVGQEGFQNQIGEFVSAHSRNYKILISAEENQIPAEMEAVPLVTAPEDFHHLLAFSAFVLTEGASTASEAACLGVPTVYINSTEQRGYLQMLQDRYGHIRRFADRETGMGYASERVSQLGPVDWDNRYATRMRISSEHPDGADFVVNSLMGPKDSVNK